MQLDRRRQILLRATRTRARPDREIPPDIWPRISPSIQSWRSNLVRRHATGTGRELAEKKRGGSGPNCCRQETHLVDEVKNLNTPVQHITPSWFSLDECTDIFDIESTP